jgi:hypothetical protein
LHQLYQFIATKEDCLAEDEVNAHGKSLPPSLLPQPSAHQNESIVWDSDKEQEVDAITSQCKRMVAIHTSLILTERNRQDA